MTRRSLLLLVGCAIGGLVLLALMAPYRSWKEIQLRGLEIEEQRLAAALEEARERFEKDASYLEGAVRVAEDAMRPRAGEIDTLEREIFQLERRWKAAQRRFEEASSWSDGPIKRETVRVTRLESESYRREVEERRARRALIYVDLYEARAVLETARRPMAELEGALGDLGRDRWIRRWPYLRLLAPSLAVRALESEELRPLDPRSSGPRVDRCITCHLGQAPADPGLSAEVAAAQTRPIGSVSESDGTLPERWQAIVFGDHPQPTLVDPSGPHAPREIGCTSCHGGNGRATDFYRAGHVAKDPQQAKTWRERWGYPAEGRADSSLPIHSGASVQASCVSCHVAEISLRGAPEAAAGRLLMGQLGCAGCHRTGLADLDSRPPVGPDLLGVESRLFPGWVARYLLDPEATRAGSRKPQIWPKGADGGEGDADGGHTSDAEVEVQALVSYLWEGDSSIEPTAAFSTIRLGKIDRGMALFDSLACGACHAGEPAPEETSRPLGTEEVRRNHGGDLRGLASRVLPEWLVAWLRDPLSAGGPRHGNFRLSRAEAADMAAFLLSDQLSGRESNQAPPPDPALWPMAEDSPARDRLLLQRLEEVMGIEASREMFDSVDGEGRTLLLGRLAFRRYGCRACHASSNEDGFSEEIRAGDGEGRDGPPSKAWEEDWDPALAGSSLARLGRRLPSEPFVAGKGDKGKGWLDQAHVGRLPWTSFGLSPAEQHALWVQALGWREDPRRNPPEVDPVWAAGRAVLAREGCRACHAYGGAGGLTLADGTHPPALDGVGRKLRADWTFRYLGDPSREKTRSWLQVRMPTFPLTGDEKEALVRAFAVDSEAPLFAGSDLLPGREGIGAVSDSVGEILFSVLACGRCHVDSRAEDSTIPAIVAVAPDYGSAGRRLRAEWVVDWILDPHAIDPQTAMPPIFPLGSDGKPDSSFLTGVIEAPMFDVQRGRLRRLFASREDLDAYLADPENVANALRAYLWSREAGSSGP